MSNGFQTITPSKESAADPTTSKKPTGELPAIAGEPTPTIGSNEFSRAGSEEAGWKLALQKVTKDLSPTFDGKAFSTFRDHFRKIEYGFSFAAEPNDRDFSPLHIEPLIDQAADLLDRGLRDRATYDDLSARFFDLILELSEYADLDRIHAEEEKSGIYEVPFKQSRAERDGERAAETMSKVAASTMQAYRTNYLSLDSLNKESAAVQLSAVASFVVPYYWQGQNFANFGSLNFGGVEKVVYEHAKDAAFRSSFFNFRNLDYTTFTQVQTYLYSEAAAKARGTGWAAKASWDAVNADFQKKRTMVARRYQDIKMQSAVDDDGILNYAKRLPALRKRFQQDFRNALARLFAVKDGLKQVYEYEVPPPSNPQAIDYFDQWLLWTRDAIQWLIRFSRQEQSAVLPISVKALVGDQAWKTGQKTGTWSVRIDEARFPNMAHIRLRGLSVCTDEDDVDKRIWCIDFKIPKTATVRRLSGSQVQLDQSKVPVVKFGRVGTRFSQREADILGVTALHNASPIGTWSIKITDKLPSKAELDDIDDVFIDLHLAFRAKP